MKKVSMVLLLSLITMVGCKETDKKIEVNYECSDYFTKDDWEVFTTLNRDTILSYSIDKNIMVNKKFPSATDSVNFTMNLDSSEFKKLPPELNFHLMIYQSLLSAKSNCKHEGTFRPFNIKVYYTDDNLWIINVEFFASNAYGTPGELNGYFTFDPKTYKMIKELVG